MRAENGIFPGEIVQRRGWLISNLYRGETVFNPQLEVHITCPLETGRLIPREFQTVPDQIASWAVVPTPTYGTPGGRARNFIQDERQV